MGSDRRPITLAVDEPGSAAAGCVYALMGTAVIGAVVAAIVEIVRALHPWAR